MESLYILIPVAVIFLLLAIAVFFWAVKSGQYEDLDTQAQRILFDDDIDPVNETEADNISHTEEENNRQGMNTK